MNFNTPMFIFIPEASTIAVFPFRALWEHQKKQPICANCRFFLQTEDWRETLEGIYLPRGNCVCPKCPHKNFHGGNRCENFKRKKE